MSLAFAFLFIQATFAQLNTLEKRDIAATYANSIEASNLKDLLYIFASDDFQGRRTGEPGQKKAVNFLKEKYMEYGVPSAFGDNNYFQIVPKKFLKNKYNDSENVLAFIKGTEKPEEVIVISAHLDHEGVSKNGDIYNGADDDGSGTIAILEIARAFKKAIDDGFRPKRSILFLHVTGEEIGLYGSQYYTENPVFPLENTVTNLNIDMIGRVDPKHEGKPNYLYLIGSDRLSMELHNISEMVNKKYTQLDFDYTYNEKNDPNRFYYRSDHYHFAKNNIPVIFYFNGTHDDYHRPTDTPEKINYEFYETRTRLIFYTAWVLANREDRVKLNGTDIKSN